MSDQFFISKKSTSFLAAALPARLAPIVEGRRTITGQADTWGISDIMSPLLL